MDASFDIRVDTDRQLVDLTLTGFFTAADACRFIDEIRAAILGLGGPRNSHVTLCDVSACKLQPQDVVAAFGEHIRDPRYRSRRLAFVVGSSAARMQVRRLTDRSDIAFFDDRAEAEDWLAACRRKRLRPDLPDRPR